MGELRVGTERNLFDPSTVTFDERQKQLEKEEQIEQERLKREKKSPFTKWAQINLEHTAELRWLAMKHPKSHALLYFLVEHMDEYNAVMCSYKVLEETFEASNATMTRAVRVLKDSGFISILKSGTSNIYAINDNVYWKSWGNNKKYSKFPANVILSYSEQEEEQAKIKAKIKKHKEISGITKIVKEKKSAKKDDKPKVEEIIEEEYNDIY